MSVLCFSGSSDDLIGVSYIPDEENSKLTVIDRRDCSRVQLSEEFNVRDGYNEFLVTVDDVKTCVVFARYGYGAVWGFGVSQVDEDTPFPDDLNISITPSEVRDYSVQLNLSFQGGNVTVLELEQDNDNNYGKW